MTKGIFCFTGQFNGTLPPNKRKDTNFFPSLWPSQIRLYLYDWKPKLGTRRSRFEWVHLIMPKFKSTYLNDLIFLPLFLFIRFVCLCFNGICLLSTTLKAEPHFWVHAILGFLGTIKLCLPDTNLLALPSSYILPIISLHPRYFRSICVFVRLFPHLFKQKHQELIQSLRGCLSRMDETKMKEAKEVQVFFLKHNRHQMFYYQLLELIKSTEHSNYFILK